MAVYTIVQNNIFTLVEFSLKNVVFYNVLSLKSIFLLLNIIFMREGYLVTYLKIKRHKKTRTRNISDG